MRTENTENTAQAEISCSRAPRARGPEPSPGGSRVPAWKILLAQLSSVVVALLIAAAIIAALMGDGLDAAVLVINTAFGFTT